MRRFSRCLLASLPPRSGAIASVIDQAVSSVTNFGALILAARHLDAESFGSFSTAYVIYTLAQAAIQALVGQELVLRDGSPELRLAHTALGVKYSIIVGAGLAVILLICAWAIPAISASLVPLAVCLPLLLAHEVARHGAAVLRAPQFALALDFTWMILLAAGMAVVATQTPSESALSAVWYGSGALSALLGLAVLRAPKLPEPLAMRRYFSVRFLGFRFLLEALAVRGVGQALALLLAVLAGLAATGAYRGAVTLFGPLNILLMSVSMFGAPRILEKGLYESRRVLLPLATVLTLVAISVTAVLWVLPEAVGRMILGDTWPSAHTLIPAFGLQAVALSFGTVYMVALRVADPRRTLPLRLVASAATIALFLAGFAWGGVQGAVWGFAGGATVGAVLVVRQYSRAMRGAGCDDAPDLLPHRGSDD